MTISESTNFYFNNKKEYQVINNNNLLSWYKERIEDGYHPAIGIEQMQKLINFIVSWYELKYPEQEFDYLEGIRNFEFNDINNLKDNMDIKQLLYRLPRRHLSLIRCEYRSTGSAIQQVYDENNNANVKTCIYMSIERKNFDSNCCSMTDKTPKFIIRADDKTGKLIFDYNLEEYTSDKEITLDDLLMIFKQNYEKELDFSKLEHCIYQHNYDLELRYMLLHMVALNLLYSGNTIPERGYERARRFINEFNKKLNLNLSLDEIDKIADRYNIDKYAYSKKQKTKLLKK